MHFDGLKRREFITLLGGTAGAWVAGPFPARAQQAAKPTIAFVSGQWPAGSARIGAAFRKGLNETGTVEGQNVAVEYHLLADSDEVARAFRDDVARYSDMMSP